jgi:hypothetical protein
MRIMIALIAGLAAVAASGAAPKAKTVATCVLTEADKIKNRSLDWATFDQSELILSNWRALDARGCHLTAAEAAADYLAHGPMPESERWHSSTRFHMGQSLGFAGRHSEAAKVVSTARRLTPVGNMDWNSYVSGTYAFLVGDKAQLIAAQKRLASSSGSGNNINNGVLIGLTHCFGKPYKIAYELQCRIDGGWVLPAMNQPAPASKN